MKNRNILEELSNQEFLMEEQTKNQKFKKFFRIATPIFVIEVIAAIIIMIYLFILPKSFCKVSTNMDSAIVYINDQETYKFRFSKPTEQTSHYYYEVDISLELPNPNTYQVVFTITCDKYGIVCVTDANRNGNVYSMTVRGGEKTQIARGVVLISNEKIKNFNVKLDIKISLV